MTNKRLFLTVMVVILAISNIAATFVYPLKVGQSKDFTNGRAGISFIQSKMAGNVHVGRKDTSRLKGENPPNFTQNLLDVRLTNFSGDRVNTIVGSVYVYFKLRGPELRLYNDGALGIYYYSDYKNEWVKCNAVLVNKRDGPRLSCRIRVFGLYGLGSESTISNKRLQG
jgi:hypothetical protein